MKKAMSMLLSLLITVFTSLLISHSYDDAVKTINNSISTFQSQLGEIS